MANSFQNFYLLRFFVTRGYLSFVILSGIVLTPQLANAFVNLRLPQLEQADSLKLHTSSSSSVFRQGYWQSSDASPLPKKFELKNLSQIFGIVQNISNETVDALNTLASGDNITKAELRALVSDVVVTDAEDQPELESLVRQQTQSGRTTARSHFQYGINAIFATELFSNVPTVLESTPMRVHVTAQVEPTPILKAVQIVDSVLQDQGITLKYKGEQLTTAQIVSRIFSSQYGKKLNVDDILTGVKQLNQVYKDNAYEASVSSDIPQFEQGVLSLHVIELVVGEIKFVSANGGNPIKMKDDALIHELETQPGKVLNTEKFSADFRRVAKVFDGVKYRLEPGHDPKKGDVIFRVIERFEPRFLRYP